ncbi:hypothetical protein OJF2_48160 [Aquisphaera giovannonii]|uniref:Uncharacterized protein n=1 Tax=Aquisphaera giovannonii TaxID=406548 RepID=A0A5B9W6G3_9BACT|nr:hypothetical protein [Aquisphaera giovannonii]QEH36256.1 hypothetical protein OJF2_48160 [Aquisphaera giovannonii]
MIVRRCRPQGAAFLGLIAAVGSLASSAHGQSAAGGSTGLGVVPLPNANGSMSLGVVPMGAAGTRASDPMGLSPIYGAAYGGAAVPMTRDQAGLYMLSASQRMLGLGNGQISGTRPAASGTSRGKATDPRSRRSQAGDDRAVPSHRRNANVPGGLASRYFNKAAAPAGGAGREPRFNRPLRYFPQRGQ